MTSISGKDTKNSITEAAGGVVKSLDGRILMMFRRGMWDLPKGHREEGETLKECAAREVCEECGLDPSGLETGEELIRTEHTFLSRVTGQTEHKRVTWFAMTYSGDPAEATPEREEDITAIEWVTLDEARYRASTSFETIQQVINKLK